MSERLEIKPTREEKKKLVAGAKEHKLPLATYVRHAALKHTDFVIAFKKKQDEEYINYQFSDTPKPLKERMVIATKEDLIR